jgi:hypothetical protein
MHSVRPRGRTVCWGRSPAADLDGQVGININGEEQEDEDDVSAQRLLFDR